MTVTPIDVPGGVVAEVGRSQTVARVPLQRFPVIKGADGAPAERKADALQRIVDLYVALGRPDPP